MKIPDSLKKVISSKVLKKAEAGGESKVSGLKTLNEVSNNLNFLPNIARDLNVARQNIFKLVKLEGGKPERANNIGSGKTEKSPTPVFKEQAPTYKKVAKEESSFEMGQRFASFFLDLFNPKKLLANVSIGAIFIAAGIITLFKDAFTGLAEYLFDAIKESFSKFMDFIKTWFDDSVQPILDEMLKFMNKIWTKVTDFFKPIFDWVGDKIKTLIDFLEPVFTYMRSIFDKAMVLISPLRAIYDGLINSIKSAESKTAKAPAPPGLEYDAEGNLQESAEERQKKAKAEESKKPPSSTEQKTTLPSTGAEGGRGGAGGPTAAELIKKDLTPSQLKWLGDADATDQNIMARMPPPAPGEKGGPPAPVTPSPAPAPAPVAPAPAPAAPAPAPKSAPAPPSTKPSAAPAPAPSAPAKPAAAPSAGPSAAPSAGAPKKSAKSLPEEGLVGQIVEGLKQSGIVSIKAISNILATIKAETGFKVRSEDLNYKSPEQIQKTFGPKRIPSIEFAQQFVKNPEALANEVYKSTDGNKEPGDGFKFRGRGFIQHTGRNQYEGIKKFTGIDVVGNPDLLNDPIVATKALAWFFLSYKNKKPEQLENMSVVNKVVGFADTTGEKAEKRIASAEQISSSISSGQNLDSISGAVASGQRQQQKPTTPVNIDASTTNNTQVTKNESGSKKQENTNKKLLERVT
jgi:putative chitinase